MKPPKTLPYTWEDLTGLEELDSEKMEDLRLMFRTMLADGPGSHLGHLQRFFEANSESILQHPASDPCVVLYRLLESQPRGILQEITAIQSKHYDGPTLDLASFVVTLEMFFEAKNTPIPVVAGFRPGIYL